MVASWSGPWLLIKIQLGRMAWSTTRGMDPGGFAAALGDWRGGPMYRRRAAAIRSAIDSGAVARAAE